MSEPEPIRVLIVEDHEVVRAGIAAMVEREPDMQLVASLPSAEEALARLDESKPDVVILDHRLPGLSGVLCCREIMRRRPTAAVLMLTTFDEDPIVHASLAAGARGFLLKEATGTDLVYAVRTVARGQVFLASQVVDRVVDWARRAKVVYAGSEFLSTDEQEVLSLAAEGLRNRDIARRLDRSEATVKVHLRAAMQKLGASERSHAVAAGIRRGII